MRISETNSERKQEKERELIEKIRSRFEEIEELIEGMKSRLPDKK